jgi:hypothetical protein
MICLLLYGHGYRQMACAIVYKPLMKTFTHNCMSYRNSRTKYQEYTNNINQSKPNSPRREMESKPIALWGMSPTLTRSETNQRPLATRSIKISWVYTCIHISGIRFSNLPVAVINTYWEYAGSFFAYASKS